MLKSMLNYDDKKTKKDDKQNVKNKQWILSVPTTKK